MSGFDTYPSWYSGSDEEPDPSLEQDYLYDEASYFPESRPNSWPAPFFAPGQSFAPPQYDQLSIDFSNIYARMGWLPEGDAFANLNRAPSLDFSVPDTSYDWSSGYTAPYATATETAPTETAPTETAPTASEYSGALSDQGDSRVRDDGKPDAIPPEVHIPRADPAPHHDFLSDPNRFFITQYKSKWNENGPSRSSNCGPASLAMAVLALDKVPAGVDPDNREKLVDTVRMAMTGNTNDSAPTNHAVMEHGAKKLGMHEGFVSGLDGITKALGQGKLVVAAGNPIHYEHALHLTGKNYGNDGQFDGGHFILVVGHQGNNFVINDPMSRTGAITISGELLQKYINDKKGGGHGGIAVWA